MVLVSQAWASCIPVNFSDENFYFSSSSPCGDKLECSALWGDNKDKVLNQALTHDKPCIESATTCLHSDLLTCTQSQIYKSQNDP